MMICQQHNSHYIVIQSYRDVYVKLTNKNYTYENYKFQVFSFCILPMKGTIKKELPLGKIVTMSPKTAKKFKVLSTVR